MAIHRPEPTASVVVPTLNEAQNIDPLLESLFTGLDDAGLAAEVVVVDDGSKDQTASRVLAWSGTRAVRLIERGAETEGGLAGAILAGAQAARGETVVVMDADLSHPPGQVPAMVRAIEAGQADLVVGSRYVVGGSTPDWPLRRRLISRLAGSLAWPLVDARDPMSGFFAVARSRLLALAGQASGFKIGLETMARGGESLRTVEQPIEFRDRVRGVSKLTSEPVIAYLKQLRTLAGGSISQRSAVGFCIVGFLGMLVDLLGFHLLMAATGDIGTSHVLSFLLASVFNYALNARFSFRDAPGQFMEPGARPWTRYARYLAVGLMALVLRGAVLELLVLRIGWPVQLAIIGAIIVASGVNYLGSAFFVFPASRSAWSANLRWRVAALGVVGYSLLLRLAYLSLPSLLHEEAYYWNYAQHPALSYLDHPPMVAWLIGLGTTLFGQNEFGVRIAAFLCWFITALFAYLTARDLFDKSTAFRSVLLVGVLPFFFVFGIFMTPDAPLAACWAGSLFFLQRALLAERGRAWIGVGICVGLGMLSKYTISLLGPATILFALIDTRSRRWFARPEPYAAMIISALLFAPVILWNANNGWASFIFQGLRRVESGREFGFPTLVFAAAVLLTPIGLIGVITAMLPKAWGGPKFDEAGLAHAPGRVRRFTLVFTLMPLTVFILFSLAHDTKLNWTGPLWLAVLPMLAWDMTPKPGQPLNWLQNLGKRTWPVAVVITMLCYGVGLHYLTLGWPGVPYPMGIADIGGRELGQRIESIEHQVEQQTGEEPLIVGMDRYGLASKLAFYHQAAEKEIQEKRSREAVRNTAGRNLFGRGSLMYGYWTPARLEQGRTMILVNEKVGPLDSDRVTGRFAKLSPIRRMTIRENGKLADRYYYRVGYGYQTPMTEAMTETETKTKPQTKPEGKDSSRSLSSRQPRPSFRAAASAWPR